MTYKCPACGEEFDVRALQQPAGIGGGSYCPRCNVRVYVSLPYGRSVALISLLIAFASLELLHIKTLIGFIIGTILIWLPLSMLLNAWSARLRPPSLKKWPPRSVEILRKWPRKNGRPRRRTFFEWLYEREAPQDLIDKRPRS